MHVDIGRLSAQRAEDRPRAAHQVAEVGAEGDVGAYWGLWDKDGKPKFA